MDSLLELQFISYATYFKLSRSLSYWRYNKIYTVYWSLLVIATLENTDVVVSKFD